MSHQPKKTSTHGLRRYGQLSISYRSYGNQTWPIKWNSFFQVAVVSILLYGSTTWTAITQECCEQYWTSPGGNTPQGTNYTATCLPSRTRYAEHCWRSRDELISDVLLWNPTYGRAKAVRPARTYMQQLCEDTGCSPEDLPEPMNDREKWRERVRDFRASGIIWWWWWWCIERI